MSNKRKATNSLDEKQAKPKRIPWYVKKIQHLEQVIDDLTAECSCEEVETDTCDDCGWVNLKNKVKGCFRCGQSKCCDTCLDKDHSIIQFIGFRGDYYRYCNSCAKNIDNDDY